MSCIKKSCWTSVLQIYKKGCKIDWHSLKCLIKRNLRDLWTIEVSIFSQVPCVWARNSNLSLEHVAKKSLKFLIVIFIHLHYCRKWCWSFSMQFISRKAYIEEYTICQLITYNSFNGDVYPPKIDVFRKQGKMQYN